MMPLQRQAKAQTLELLLQAQDQFKIRLPEVRITFDLRGRSAGMLRLPRSGAAVIRYNAQLLTENDPQFIAQTIPHEVAHLVAMTLHGRGIRPHGAEWKAVMEAFGAAPERCHQFDVSRPSRRRLRRFTYQCNCREHQLSSIRHNRAQRGTRYLCRHCKTSLRPVE